MQQKQKKDKKQKKQKLYGSKILDHECILMNVCQFLCLKQILEMRLINKRFKYLCESSIHCINKLKYEYRWDFCEVYKLYYKLKNIRMILIDSFFMEFMDGSCELDIQNYKTKLQKVKKINAQFWIFEKEYEQFSKNAATLFPNLNSIALKESNAIPSLLKSGINLLELDLFNVGQCHDPTFLLQLSNLVSLTLTIHQNDGFFETYDDSYKLLKLKRLKIKLWGSSFDTKKNPGLQAFIRSIPNIEVLELLLLIFSQNGQKQFVFDKFYNHTNIQYLYLENGLTQMKKNMQQKNFQILALDNNISNYLEEIDFQSLEYLLSITKTLDISQASLSLDNQNKLQEYLQYLRNRPQKFKKENIIMINKNHTQIQASYVDAPIVRKVNEFQSFSTFRIPELE